MKIATILGSPRRKGNTANVLSRFEALVAPKHEVDRIDIASHMVNGCLGCGKCREKYDEPGCVQKDDALAIFERMMKADALVYASPLYCWDFSAQMKALIDRHFCLVKGYGTPDYKSLLDGKRVALLVTCDGPIEENADVIQVVFDRVSDYSKCETVGKYIVPSCAAPGVIDSAGGQVARRMAADIAGR